MNEKHKQIYKIIEIPPDIIREYEKENQKKEAQEHNRLLIGVIGTAAFVIISHYLVGIL